MAEPKAIGKVSSYYSNIGVAAVELTDKIKLGDKVRFKGTTTDFTQTITSIQIEHEIVKEAKRGYSIGVKVENKVKPNDLIYKA